ncbi:P-loop containing nucleoside triphosphate hydrolase protein [Dentipellis sp. KUC8613]|nr:P-loop containing nucleoside triphosphate hydrolase protein [Dentipellis sp. KUC8613]
MINAFRTLSSPGLVTESLFLLLIIVATYALWMWAQTHARTGVVLLLGPTDAGKTSILSSLIYRQVLHTHVSLQTNISSILLPNGHTLPVIDVPGHPRMRGQFQEYLSNARAVVFVVDASNVSRIGPSVAEHLHLVLNALVSLPPSVPVPPVLILAHKCDALTNSKISGISGLQDLAVTRVRTVLERELEMRRISEKGAVGVEDMEADRGNTSDVGSLDYCNASGGTFRFTQWEGSMVDFLGTTLGIGSIEETSHNGLHGLTQWLQSRL